MTGAVFGAAAFAWSGWAQEGPPRGWPWRALLALFGVTGAVLAGWSGTLAARHWGSGTAISPGSRGFTLYLIVFWAEVVIAVVAGIALTRIGRTDLLAPLVLFVVGLHFVALAWVFGQPVLHIVAALLVAAAVVSALLPAATALRSFWCGVLGAPVFLVVGWWTTSTASAVLTGG
ncbi:MAG: hypothetical protein ACRCXL_01125 [Dermatophilaceae bacterium]